MTNLRHQPPLVPEPLKCRCLIDCPDGSDNSTCILKPFAKCYKKLFINDFDEEEIRAGCLGSQTEQLDQCNKLADPSFSSRTDLRCCSNFSLCNDHLVMELPEPILNDDIVDGSLPSEINVFVVVISTIICFCILFGTMIMFYFINIRRRENRRKREIAIENQHADYPVFYPNKRYRAHGGKKNIDMLYNLPHLNTTASDTGIPLLVQRTISKQIEIKKEIGKGRFGSVMLGKWRDEFVALKIYNLQDKERWDRETEIYQTVMLRHDNILGFIAADISGSNAWKQLFLITEYHPQGSLFDYLHNHVVNVVDAIRFALSASSGLSHLHAEVTGTQGQGKPAIAHRDVKSKNILVKSDGECCIGDMSLAVQYSRNNGLVNFGSCNYASQKGTTRYMAPEVITQSFHPESFAAHKAADVYGFALVMWEIANRTRVKGVVSEYRPPFYDAVGDDPGLEAMHKVVVIENLRPEILQEWEDDELMSTFCAVMQECWVNRYESRLSMLRIRKTLKSLIGNDQKMATENSSTSSDRKSSLSWSTTNPLQDSTVTESLQTAEHLTSFQV